jgi:(1->4)-alpha-D-glucan 1-alpha-D-glucosylmutase
VGSFPSGEIDEAALESYRGRIVQYMTKAAREAKRHTGWINPNEAYEAALKAFVGAALGRREGNLFLDDLRAALPTFEWFGALNGISMAALKFTSPGVPDVYQGSELITLSLVDPDNRRPVDYAMRRDMLNEVRALAHGPDPSARLQELLLSAPDGRAKLWTTWRALQLRREHEDLFSHGEYLPVAVHGPRANHALAFARRHRDALAIVVAGRLFASMGLAVGAPPIGEVWSDTVLKLAELADRPMGLVEVFSGRRIEAVRGELPLTLALEHFPAAVFVASLS